MTLATAPRRAARRMSSEDTLALWREYRRTNDRSLRDRLVLTFAPLVKYIVYKKLREMPRPSNAGSTEGGSEGGGAFAWPTDMAPARDPKAAAITF